MEHPLLRRYDRIHTCWARPLTWQQPVRSCSKSVYITLLIRNRVFSPLFLDSTSFPSNGGLIFYMKLDYLHLKNEYIIWWLKSCFTDVCQHPLLQCLHRIGSSVYSVELWCLYLQFICNVIVCSIPDPAISAFLWTNEWCAIRSMYWLVKILEAV